MSLSAAEHPAAPVEPHVEASGKRRSVAFGLPSQLVVYLAAGVYGVVFAIAGAMNYAYYYAWRFDLGNMVQAVWSTSHGHFLRMTTADGTEIMRFAGHVDPFLALLAPVWWLWPSPVALIAVQAIAVSCGALPVYWLARKHLGTDRAARGVALVYLLYPATQFNALTTIGVHPVSFAIPFILFAIWFLDEDRLVPFTIFAILAASTKEEIAAAVGGLGIWYAVRRGHRIVGGAIFVIGAGITCFEMLVVIPHYAVHGVQPFAGRYEDVGGTPGGILHAAYTDPGAFVHEVATWHKLAYVLIVFAPFLGLWLLEPWMLVGAVPDLAINLLSAKPEQTTIFYQYTAGIVPFVVAASVLGAAKLHRRRRRALVSVAAIMGCLSFVSPLVGTAVTVHNTSSQQVSATRHAVSLIPRNAPISASQSVGAFLSARRFISTFPSLRRAEWVVVGPMATPEEHPHAFRATLARLKSDPAWRTLYDANGISVFKRR